MEERKNKILQAITLALFFTGSFLFFNFSYRYHFIFTEQLQVFTLTIDHFLAYLSRPAFLSSYAGDFLTQFYFLSGGAAAVITVVLFLLWLLTRLLLRKTAGKEPPVILTLLPPALAWIAICDPEYPVANIIAILISVSLTLLFLVIKSRKIRIPAGLILLVLIYISAGSSFYVALLVMILFELKHDEQPGRFISILLFILAATIIPWSLRAVYLLKPGQAFFYLSEMTRIPQVRQFLPVAGLMAALLAVFFFPSIQYRSSTSIFLARILIIAALLFAGISMVADFTMEKVLQLDYEARRENWNRILDLAGRYDMHNNLAAYYFNMALGKTGRLPEELTEHYQPAATGLFIPVNANENYLTITLSNEIYWQLGDVNASQHSCLLGTIFSPRGQNSRLLKRLVEINIVNGQYAAAEKFITILEKTMFHRRWASGMRKFLYNESACSSSEWISARRKIIPSKDLLKKGNEYIATLRMLAGDHPSNRLAVDYLLCFHLLSKDIEGFLQDFEKYFRPDNSAFLPEAYQEALLVLIIRGERKHEDFSAFRFSPLTVKNMADFTRLFSESNGDGKLLQKKFGKTYWFYYHFAKMKTD